MKKYIFLILIFITVIIIFYVSKKDDNPYKDVVWIEDYPGANGRVKEFIPVLKSNSKIKLSEGFGADYATISFKDIDNDGIKETIIESKMPFYLFEDMYQPTKIVIKYIKKGKDNPNFKIIEQKNL